MRYDVGKRSVNHRLIYWQQRSGLNNTRLAAAIRERAGERGHRQVQPDARRVRAWRHGERPRDPVPELILEVLFDRIGTSLTLSDIGLDGAGADRFQWDGPLLPIQTATELISSARSDLVVRQDITELRPPSLLAGHDLLRIVQSWTTTAAASSSLGMSGGRKRISDQEVMQIRAVTDAFRTLDNAYGGGLTREAIIGQLLSTASLVEETTYTEEVGRKLITQVGDLATVAGWMCHDVSMHAAAQRYFLLALQAAKEADAPNLGAHVLSCMARQAGHLGSPEDALELIHLARYGARHTATPTMGAILHGLEARYYAMMGRLKDFDRAAGRAEATFADSDPGQDPAWVAYFDTSEYYATLGICHQIAARCLGPGEASRRAVDMIGRALALRHPSRTRSRAFDHVGLARAYLAEGELDAAAAAGTTAVELTCKVSSARVRDRLCELLRETRPYEHVTAIADLRSRIHDQFAGRPLPGMRMRNLPARPTRVPSCATRSLLRVPDRHAELRRPGGEQRDDLFHIPPGRHGPHREPDRQEDLQEMRERLRSSLVICLVALGERQNGGTGRPVRPSPLPAGLRRDPDRRKTATKAASRGTPRGRAPARRP